MPNFEIAVQVKHSIDEHERSRERWFCCDANYARSRIGPSEIDVEIRPFHKRAPFCSPFFGGFECKRDVTTTALAIERLDCGIGNLFVSNRPRSTVTLWNSGNPRHDC
jgi:hypothetical protein